MKDVQFEILRRKSPESEPYLQTVTYSCSAPSETVAYALTELSRGELSQDPVRWQCSCLQRKCGACAMVINGRPRLACDARLGDLGDKVTLGPLKKFPVVADLIVDRSAMMNALLRMQVWLSEAHLPEERAADLSYDASRCLQCGCCLEVCPNFAADGEFYGMAALAPSARLMAALPDSQKKQLFRDYRRHIYEGCGKSLACRDICPAGIDTERLLVNANAAAVWKRRFGRR